MIPYILAAVGGYLIGDSLKGKQYAENYSDGGRISKGVKWKQEWTDTKGVEGYDVLEIEDTKYFSNNYGGGIVVRSRIIESSKPERVGNYQEDSKTELRKIFSGKYPFAYKYSEGGKIVNYEKIKNYPTFETEEEAKKFIKIGKPFLRKELKEGKIVLLYNGKEYFLANVKENGEGELKGKQFAKGGMTDEASKIYKLADEMTDAEYEEKFSQLNEKQKSSVKSLIRLGDTPKLALATILFGSYELDGNSDTWKLYTMAKGGQVKVGDILTANTGVKVKVVEYDPKFGGRVRVERMDEYATGKPSQFMPLSRFKYADGGVMEDGDVEFKPYGKTKGIFKLEYKVDGEHQSEIWESKEMVEDSAKRYSKIGYTDIKITELKKMAKGGQVYKLGDKWSPNFDYTGMLETALKAQVSWGMDKLRKLYDSLEDVNYHTASRSLWEVLKSLKDNDVKAAEKHLENFRADVMEELK